MSDTAAQATAAQGPTRSAFVSRMFGRIAPRYDLMNTLMTLGQDRRWRRLTARLAAGEGGGLALDIGAGSGELSLELAALGCRTVGMDFCRPMMDVARDKLESRKDLKVYLAAADALDLPFADATFDCMTAGFALRNLADLGRGLREMHRTLKVGGRLAVLELTPPRSGVTSFLHGIYTHRIVPVLGTLVARDSAAYTYLPQSVDHFPDAEALCRVMLEAGFGKASYRKLGMGMVAIHVAEKTR
ncbi:MAG: ubiquinone/menaquinone biosynthesis methyltransferase [Dehalococcoidia bacterium]|nr:ubiquinone/menaquinone biosynthesis methyltransferase [Dehalococcoidia bacterium]